VRLRKGALCKELAEFRCKGNALFIVVSIRAWLSRGTEGNSLDDNIAYPVFLTVLRLAVLYRYFWRFTMRQSNQILVTLLSVSLFSSAILLAQPTTHTVSNNSDSGVGSFRHIIENLAENGDTIVFAPGVNTVTLTTGVLKNHIDTTFPVDLYTLFINGLTIDGGSSGVTIISEHVPPIDWEDQVRRNGIFPVSEITLKNLTLTSSGSAIYFPSSNPVGGSLTINTENVTFNSCAGDSAVRLGVIFGTLTFNNTGTLTFSNNTTGAVMAPVVIFGDNVTFINNSGGNSGGVNAIDMTLGNNATFTGNTSAWGGAANGGAANRNMRFGNAATFINNTATNGGGAVFCAGGEIVFGSHGVFVGNTAGGGGAIEIGGVEASLAFGSNTLFDGNTATGGGTFGGSGGTISTIAGDVSFSGNTFFTGNLASGEGGAIYFYNYNPRAMMVLNANDGNIAFSGNKSGVSFANPSNPTGGTPNSIHMRTAVTLDIRGTQCLFR